MFINEYGSRDNPTMMAEAAGCALRRKHTLVAGDGECDYWIVGEQK